MHVCNIFRIGFAIARQLAKDGAKVVISSRKSDKVKAAVEKLKLEQLNVYGTVCHVGKAEDRKRLVEEVFTVVFVLHQPISKISN